MIIQNRRRFITGLASLIAAPAIVPYASLMPVRGNNVYVAFTSFFRWNVPVEVELRATAVDKIVLTGLPQGLWRKFYQGTDIFAALAARDGSRAAPS